MQAAILGDEQAGHLTLNTGGDQHRSRIGERLHPGGAIGRIAEDFSGRIHHRPALDVNVGDDLRLAQAGVVAVQFGERALDAKRRANCALGIVLCAIACPNNAISPSPSFVATRPPICATASHAASR
jgi:hypothetical protein